MRWTWLSLPYLLLTVLLVGIAVHTLLSRGDRVMRVGVVGAVAGSLPWALCSALAMLFHEPDAARRLLRLGNGPSSLIGPSVLLLLLGASGHLERHRWVVRSAGLVGAVSMLVTWTTDLMIRDVQLLPSGIYVSVLGPLMVPHVGLIAVWASVGVFVIRRATPGHARNRALHMLVAILLLGTGGLVDALLAYNIAGWFPLAWLPAIICALIAIHLIRNNDLLRRQGFNWPSAAEGLVLFTGGAALAGAGVASIFGSFSDLSKALTSATVLVLAVTLARRWASGGALAREPLLDDAVTAWAVTLPETQELPAIERAVQTLWQKHLRAPACQLLRVHSHELHNVHETAIASLPPTLVPWFLRHRDVLAAADLATMLVGERRPQLETFVKQGGWDLWMPLVVREQLWGFVVAKFDAPRALADTERVFVAATAEAVGRAGARAVLLQQSLAASIHDRDIELAKALREQAEWASMAAPNAEWDVLGHKSNANNVGYVEHSWHIDGDRIAVLALEIRGATTSSALLGGTALGAFVTLAHTPELTAAQLHDQLRAALGDYVDQTRVHISVALLTKTQSDFVVDAQHHATWWPNRAQPTALSFVVGATAIGEAQPPATAGLHESPLPAQSSARALMQLIPADCRLAIVTTRVPG
ncbi:MAG: hypothetical protein KBG15_15080 [Kofleriaceae bacterium]|nr:hypothetical protein [Kofleriaceae bacterium]